MKRAAYLLALATALQLACSGDVQAPPARATAAGEFLNDLVNAMEATSVRRDVINWTHFRDTVLSTGSGATSLNDAMPAARLALELLGDNHTWLRRPNGTIVTYPKTVACGTAAVPAPDPMPIDIGYVRVAWYDGTSEESGLYTGGIQDVYRASDAPELVGWIVDLRGNIGGNMWPMLAALWPFLQGATGYAVNADSSWFEWRVTGALSLGGGVPRALAASPYAPRATANRVAVLIDNGVASAGEAVAIAFKGRADTRFLGIATCGLSTSIEFVPLDSGYVLGLAHAAMADRDSTVYGGVIAPDETIVDADSLLARAIAWIRGAE